MNLDIPETKSATAKRITAEEFQKIIEIDPSWCKNLTEDVEITGYCNMTGSKITHLSKHLHFTGKGDGLAASFLGCQNLKVAEGNFSGFVTFQGSRIEKIDTENLKITEAAVRTSICASFVNCYKLKVATGTFPSFVDFSDSGIEKIENLNITKPSILGKAAFLNCTKLATTAKMEWLLNEEYTIEEDLKKFIQEKRKRRLEAEKIVRSIKSEPSIEL